MIIISTDSTEKKCFSVCDLQTSVHIMQSIVCVGVSMMSEILPAYPSGAPIALTVQVVVTHCQQGPQQWL